MKNITIILPIHKLDDDYSQMLLKAVESTKDFYNDVKLLIVAPSKLKKDLEQIDLGQKMEYTIKFHGGETDFCSQVNLGINSCDTEWFSILEVDDEYQKIWLKSMKEYVENYTDVDVFLPLVKDIDLEGNFTNFTNESVWAYGFSEKQGYLDNEVLLEFQSYQISGGLYKTKAVIESGNLKENIKLTFGYELLLRLTHNGSKIMVVPRIGYRHVNLRDDSLFWLYKNDEETKLKENEAKFWVDTAKKEFFFKNKREVNYIES